MKKLFFAVILVFMMTQPVWSAGACVQSPLSSDSEYIMMVKLVCTADAAAATYPVATFVNLSQIKGWYWKHLKIAPGSTGPTADSDVTFTEVLDAATGQDLLQTRGTNLIENAAVTSSYFGVGHDTNTLGTPALITSESTYKVTITGNSVNSAVITLRFYAESP